MWLWATEALAVDVVDIAGERISYAKIDLETSADYHKNMVKSTLNKH